MALKKSQLYSSLWQSCDELRGGMDASQYSVSGVDAGSGTGWSKSTLEQTETVPRRFNR